MTNRSQTLLIPQTLDRVSVPTKLLTQVLWLLFRFDIVSRFRSFDSLRGWAVPCARRTSSLSSGTLCLTTAAVDLACTLYPKTAYCLQRSSVLCRLLRLHGIEAHVVIGVKQFPFRSHAWVELEGIPLGDSRRVKEAFVELDRW